MSLYNGQTLNTGYNDRDLWKVNKGVCIYMSRKDLSMTSSHYIISDVFHKNGQVLND